MLFLKLVTSIVTDALVKTGDEMGDLRGRQVRPLQAPGHDHLAPVILTI